MRQRLQSGRRDQAGYALIAILFGAAVMAVLLARALPRDAMSAQRVREERLIYRGEEYVRAIELYFRDHKKYPEDLDDLEDTNGVRYLRKRYKDPITGEDEWRLIRMGTDGRFKDSLIYDLEDEGRRRRRARQFRASERFVRRTGRRVKAPADAATPPPPSVMVGFDGG